jgi:hypothetical protein
MSTLSTANIQSKAANTPPVIKDLNGTECGQLCRAWINFDGTGTVAIRGSFNVSSITDNGTGNYTVTFANAMANANYTVPAAGSYNATAAVSWIINVHTFATGSFRAECRNESKLICAAVFGG